MAVAAGQGEEEEAPTVDDGDSLRSECAEDRPWMRLLFASEEPQSFDEPEGAAARGGEEAECAAAEAREEDWTMLLPLRRCTTRTTAADDGFEETLDALARGGGAICPALSTLEETACMFVKGGGGMGKWIDRERGKGRKGVGIWFLRSIGFCGATTKS